MDAKLQSLNNNGGEKPPQKYKKMKALINKKKQKAQQIAYDLYNTQVAYSIMDSKGNKLSWNEICDLIESEHIYLQDWFLRGKDIKEVAGMLWLKGLTKRNSKTK